MGAAEPIDQDPTAGARLRLVPDASWAPGSRTCLVDYHPHPGLLRHPPKRTATEPDDKGARLVTEYEH
jgi:hypothetical protein